MGELESLGQQVDERGVDVIDALTDAGELIKCGPSDVSGQILVYGHSPTIMHTRNSTLTFPVEIARYACQSRPEPANSAYSVDLGPAEQT